MHAVDFTDVGLTVQTNTSQERIAGKDLVPPLLATAGLVVDPDLATKAFEIGLQARNGLTILPRIGNERCHVLKPRAGCYPYGGAALEGGLVRSPRSRACR